MPSSTARFIASARLGHMAASEPPAAPRDAAWCAVDAAAPAANAPAPEPAPRRGALARVVRAVRRLAGA